MNVRKTPNSLLTLDPFHEGRSLWTQPRGSAPGEDLLYTPFQSDQEHVLEPSGNLLDLPYPPRSTHFTRSGEGRVRGFLMILVLLVPVFIAAPAGADDMRVPEESAVLSAVEAYLSASLPWADADIDVSLATPLKRVELPAGELSFRVAQK